MRKFTKLLLTLAMLFGAVGVNSVKAETIVTKTPVILKGGKFAESFTSGTYAIQMQGWQNFIAYENADGVAFDENSTMVFDLAEAVNNGAVRVTFTFSDESTQETWWCLGIGTSADDPSTPYNHDFDNSTYWLKKGLGDSFESKKELKITKVTVSNFNYSIDGVAQLVTYKVNGGTICGQPMTIKNSNTTAFGAYSGVFTATSAQTNIFQMTKFEVSDYQKLVVKFAEKVPANGNWAYNYQSGVWPPSIPVDATELEIPLDGTALPEFTIFNWDANPDPISISEVYLYKEEAADVLLTFNEYGSAKSNKKDLVAEGGLSYDPSTGVLTSDGTAGTLTLEFTEPVNLEDLNTFDVKRSGNNNIVNRLKFYDSKGGEINTWNNAKWSNTGLDYNATKAFKSHDAVKKLVWQADANDGNKGETLTITGIDWQLKTIGAMKGTDIMALPYKLWSADGDNDATVEGDATPTTNFGVVTGNVVYGSDAISNTRKYVDLTNYKKLIVRGYGNIRLFYNWIADPQTKPETSLTNNSTTVKTLELDIPTFMKEKGISHFHLVGVKTNWGAELFVESISVLDGTEKYDYTFSGRGGLKLQSAVEALADETATAIDATGLTNDIRFQETLTTENPNCLIFVNSEQLTNEKNVVVAGTCANLELTDAKPFKAPVAFTAKDAKFTKTVGNAEYATMVIPFAAAVPAGVKAYNLTDVAGEKITSEEVNSLTADEPVMINATAGDYEFTASDAEIAATPDDLLNNGLLNGAYATITAAANEGNYVLQNSATNGVNFYWVNGTAATVKPFRAYLTASAVAARTLYLDLDNLTGIDAAIVANEAENGEVYNLAGQRVAQPQKGLYIVNGKKVIVK